MTSETYDVGIAAHQAAEKHLSACWEALYEDEDGEGERAHEEVESPAVGPFCGCDTCLVREVLAGAWPVIERYFVEQRGARPLDDQRDDSDQSGRAQE